MSDRCDQELMRILRCVSEGTIAIFTALSEINRLFEEDDDE